MLAVTFYDPDPNPSAAPERMQKRIETYPRHRAYLDEFAKSGDVVLIGAFGDPATQGSMAVFRSREAAERFIADDPFFTEGLVHSYRIQDWDPLVFGTV